MYNTNMQNLKDADREMQKLIHQNNLNSIQPSVSKPENQDLNDVCSWANKSADPTPGSNVTPLDNSFSRNLKITSIRQASKIQEKIEIDKQLQK